MKSTSILGISMTRRSRRRMLVAVVYLLLAAFVVFGVVLRHNNNLLRPGDFLGGFNLLFVILFTGVSRVIFGQMVDQTTFPVPPQEGPGSGLPVSLLEYARKPASAPDERDLAVRNRAYFLAFRIIAAYSALLWLVYVALNSWTTQVSVNLAALLLFPLIVMAITLPQAILLWSEPDLPAPDEELRPATASHLG
jgi:hypothetical protein